MSPEPDAMPDASTVRDADGRAELPPTRIFSWLLRRELWEHRSLYIAPAVVAAFGVVGYLIGSLVLPNATRAARLADPAQAHDYMEHYGFVAGTVFVTGVIVSILYSLGALHGERRDRSILFWKSLPVSDRMTVLSKAAVPLLVMPVIVFAIVVVAQLVMAALVSLIWVANGFDPRAMWAQMNLPFLWLVLGYGLIFMALWHAPLFAWFLLVSAWARRVPFLWAAAPLAALVVIGHFAHRTPAGLGPLEQRLAGGFTGPFTVGSLGREPVSRLTDLDPVRLFGQPGVWIGLIVAAAFLFAAIRLRRSRGPI